MKPRLEKGPEPTLVQYALKIPNTFPILFGAIPNPEDTPAVIVFDDVTKGYDPKSISNRVPLGHLLPNIFFTPLPMRYLNNIRYLPIDIFSTLQLLKTNLIHNHQILTHQNGHL